MKTRSREESLVHALARTLGGAAGTVAKVTHSLAINAAARVQSGKSSTQANKASGRRPAAKKSGIKRPSARISRKRASHKTA